MRGNLVAIYNLRGVGTNALESRKTIDATNLFFTSTHVKVEFVVKYTTVVQTYNGVHCHYYFIYIY